MKKIGRILKNYKLMIIVEFLVVVIMLGSAGIVCKLTYDLKCEKAWNLIKSVGQVTDFDEKSDRQVSDFVMNLQNCIGYYYDENNSGNKYFGYGITCEIYDENNKLLQQSKENELMLIWNSTEESEDDASYVQHNKAYLVESYFTEEEMEGAWDFILSIGVEDAVADIIEKVVGYYDENNEFIPVEIVLWDFDSKESYSLKSKENINKEGVEYITKKGDSIASDYVDADEDGFFTISNVKKRKESVNKAIQKGKEDEGDDIAERDYIYVEYDLSWKTSVTEDAMTSEAQGKEYRAKIGVCADLYYMTFNDMRLKLYLIIDILLCLLIGVGIAYITRKNDEKRKYLDSMKYTFINAMAHEMKTPSAVIVNSVECINDGIKPEKQSKYLEKVKKEGLHMNRLLLDMLTYTKLTDEDRKINREEVNMKELFEEVIEHYTDAIEKKNIELQWDVSSENIVMADRKLMEMVVDNYLSNAVKYCEPSGVIKITIDDKSVVVFNNGEIIYPTKQKAIWEPLYVGDESRKNREGSSGMGLAISAKILNLHDMEYGCRNAESGVEFYIKTDK